MPHVLVTGGAGFIGTHTTRALLASGQQVRVFDNFSSGVRANLHTPDNAQALHSGQLRITEGDIRDAQAVNAAVAGSTSVLHLAAQVSVQRSVDAPLESASHNLSGFLNVLEAVRQHKVPRLVYASSAAVFGSTAKLPVLEGTACAPLSPYGLEKHINEQYAALYRTLHGVSSVGMRYFNVYGPLQDPSSPYAGVISKFASALQHGQALRVRGNGLQTRDFVYVGDVAQANLRALGAAFNGVLNVGSGQSITLVQLIDALSHAFCQTGQAATTAPFAEIIHEAPARGDIMHSATRIDGLRAALQWQPTTTLADGLQALAVSMANKLA